MHKIHTSHDTWLKKKGLHPDQLKKSRCYHPNGKEKPRAENDFPVLVEHKPGVANRTTDGQKDTQKQKTASIFDKEVYDISQAFVPRGTRA